MVGKALCTVANQAFHTIDRARQLSYKGDAGSFFLKAGSPMQSPTRILYVEDNLDTRDLVSLVLRKNDFEVVTVANPEEAIELAQTERFSLYILDNWMEGMTGRSCPAKPGTLFAPVR